MDGVETAPVRPAPVAGTPAPRRPTPSVRPALVVVGIALLLILAFGIGAALTSSAPSPSPAVGPVHGTTIAAELAAPALQPIEILGTPPADVLDALVLPRGSRPAGATPWQGETQFNGSMRFALTASQAAIVSFFRSELTARRWKISAVGAAQGHRGATEVLAQMASTDGWYWEVGVVVFPTAFGTGSAAGVDTTRYSVDLFEVPEAQ